MPRGGRGGMRKGAIGQSYGNRTDLNASMPIETAKNQGYGVAAAQQAAQRAIPVAAQPVPGATAAPAAQQAPAAQSISGNIQMPATSKLPGDLMWDHPTERPDEHITHGVDAGLGAGSEVMMSPNHAVEDFSRSVLAGNHASQTLLDVARVARELNF